jgi:PIN domain nuclease of toxin-antitoxin system
MNPSAPAVLLDTCAVIWLANGNPLHQHAAASIVRAGLSGGIFVSPASAWEIGLLAKPRSGRGASVQFKPDPKTWFARFAAGPGIRLADLTPNIAIDASWLPGDLHGDPGDRMIIATARHLRIPIVTRDSNIIDYAAAGHVEVIAC